MSQTLALRGGASTKPRRPYRYRERRALPWRALLLAALALLVLVGVGAYAAFQAGRAGVQTELERIHAPPEVAAFYESRGYQPLWLGGPGPVALLTGGSLTPEGRQMAAIVDGSLPGEVSATTKTQTAQAVAAAETGGPQAARRAEVALTVALADELRSQAIGPGGLRLAFLDPDFGRPATLREALDDVGQAPDLGKKLAELKTVNPVYQALRAQYDDYVGDWAAHHGGPPPQQALILANLERARLLPASSAKSFVLVNPASGQMLVYEDGKPVDAMKVVVGKPAEQTPMMAGLLRYLVFNPYWEVPADLVRSGIAPKVLAGGVAAFKAEHLQALSDWSDDAVEVDPATVDWKAVAAGKTELHVRQVPGADNMMGSVKFMLPNELGIYLHDTPNRGAFGQAQRLLSAGCVRLERAHDLAARLLGGRMAEPDSLAPDTRVDLESPVPVYISYLTAAPGPNGLEFHPDVYGRDPGLLAAQPKAR